MPADSLERLRASILGDAEARAGEEVERAREQAADEVERARREAAEEGARIRREAEHEAAALRRQIESAGELASRRRLIEARERLIRQVLDQAMDEASRRLGPEARRESLLRLVVEAARGIGGGRLVVEVSPEDVGLLTSGFLAEAREALAREGVSAELVPADRPAEIAGGAIVRDEAGRLVVDNSLEARLRSQQSSLREEVWKRLAGE